MERLKPLKNKNPRIRKEEVGDICVGWENYRPEKLYQKFAEV